MGWHRKTSPAEQPDKSRAFFGARVTLADEDVTYLEELYQPLVNLLTIGTS